MSGWTPGPWRVDGGEDVGGRVLATDARETIVCGMTGAWQNATVQADAHLIAAAPDLYKTLEDAAEAFRILAEVADDILGEDDALRERESACRNVLAKARGEAQ